MPRLLRGEKNVRNGTDVSSIVSGCCSGQSGRALTYIGHLSMCVKGVDVIGVSSSEVTDWLESYYDAWRGSDPEAAARLFTSDAVYSESPYERPWPVGKRMTGRQQIAEYWEHVTVDLSRFIDGGFDLWAVDGDRAFARWWADAEILGEGYWVDAEGILRLTFVDRVDERLLCGELLEWNPAIPEAHHHRETHEADR